MKCDISRYNISARLAFAQLRLVLCHIGHIRLHGTFFRKVEADKIRYGQNTYHTQGNQYFFHILILLYIITYNCKGFFLLAVSVRKRAVGERKTPFIDANGHFFAQQSPHIVNLHNAISSLYSFRLIANLAMIEFASHPDYSLPSDEGIRAVRKDDAMYPSSRRLKVRCGGFFSIRRVITGRTQKSKQGEKLFQILLHLRVSAQKVSKLKSVRQFRPNAFKFPQFPPGISHFQSRLAKIRESGIYSRRPRFFGHLNGSALYPDRNMTMKATPGCMLRARRGAP